MDSIVDDIGCFDRLSQSYSGDWLQTKSSLRAVHQYKQLGYKSVGPDFNASTLGDTLFILASGPTINEITRSDWNLIGSSASLAFDNFITHPFVPNYFFVSSNMDPQLDEKFLECLYRREREYADVLYFAHGEAVRSFRFHEARSAAHIMEHNRERLYFVPELFVHSKSRINPVRSLRTLIEQGVFQHGRMSKIVPKIGATVPLLHVFGALLGYRKIVLCGVDTFDNSHFFDAKYAADVSNSFKNAAPAVVPYPQADSIKSEFSIKRILVDQAREMHRHWQVETYCMSARSILYPALPLYESATQFSAPAIVPSKREDRPLRIAMLTQSFFPTVGGMELQLHNLATRLSARGHDVTVFAPRSKSRPKPAPRYELRGFAPHLSQDPYLSNPRREPLGYLDTSLPRLFRVEHLNKPFDVISSHSAYLVSNLASALRGLYDVPVVTRCHGMDINRVPELQYGWRLDPRKDKIITQALRSSDCSVAISSDVAAEMAEIVTRDRIVTIHNGVDTEQFRPGPSLRLHERCNLSPDTLIGLTVGRNVPKKRFDLAVLAMSRLASDYPNFHLAFVGPGCAPLGELAQKIGVQDRVHILGQVAVSETPEYFRSADLFVFPSVLETFGAVTAEAMASGVPVVAFDAPGTRDQVVDGETGILVRNQTAESLAEGIARLLSSSQLRSELAANARKRALECFSWHHVVEAYETVFREVAYQPYTSNLSLDNEVVPDVEAFDRGYIKVTKHAPLFVKAAQDRVKLVIRDTVKALIRRQ